MNLNSRDNVYHIECFPHRGNLLVNGCFDIVHRGHVALFEFCAKHSMDNKVIVATNSDESIKKLKGSDRPFIKEEDRVALLSSIKWIDYVVIFDTKSVLPVIEKILPKILVKGGDYNVKPNSQHDRIVGQDFVKSYGGRVLTGPMVEGVSTTNIIKKIKERC